MLGFAQIEITGVSVIIMLPDILRSQFEGAIVETVEIIETSTIPLGR